MDRPFLPTVTVWYGDSTSISTSKPKIKNIKLIKFMLNF
jgi:hypothetical protein